MSNVSVIESEYDECVVDDTDYVQEAEQIVYNYSKISIENALILNQQMRIYLNDLKKEVEQLLNVCQEKYKQNERLLSDMSKVKSEPKLYTTYYFCGYPYFKDRKGGAPPKPAEYLRRSEKGDEIFPLDLEKHGVWLPRDKVELIQGVKKQVVSYLQSQNRVKLRQTAGKRCANELSARINIDGAALENMRLKELFKKTEGTKFHINWLDISMDALQDRHSIKECMAMWYGYLMPTLNRKSWTQSEEDKLLNAAIEFGSQNWSNISEAVENRSVFQCFVHYQTHFNNKNLPKNVRWTDDEDQKLMESVEKYRIGSIIPWTKIMEHFTNRSKIQVYNRYMFTLNPEINRAPFTVEEDCILMAAIKEYGLNYSDFPTNLLPGRSMKQIRSRYNNVLKFVNVREHWTEHHDEKLVELVDRYGTSEWAKISEELVSHTRTSCRQRYTTIQKFLRKHPDKTISDVPRRKRAFSTNVTTDNWMEAIIEAKNFDSIEAASEDESERDVTEKNCKTKKSQQTGVGKSALYSTAYFDFFKYSFNFKFGETIPGSDALFENIQIACQLLQAPALPRQIDVSDVSFSSYVTMQNNSKKVRLEPDLLQSLIQLGRNDFLYPVNLNTILGLRGLTLMFETVDKKKAPPKRIKRETNTAENHDALNLFKMRFNSIFKHSAAIANLQRTSTSVSLRLRNHKRKRFAEKATKSAADRQPRAKLVRTATVVEIKCAESEIEECTTSECDEKSSKEHKIILLDSAADPLQFPQPSTSGNTAFSRYARYRVETSNTVQEVHIQPYVSESDTETTIDDYTDFVIWTPTITDEATGST